MESSGDDSDVVMEDSEDEGPPAKGAKGKKAAKGGKQQQQQAGSEAAAKKGGSQATPTAKAAPSGGRKLPGSLVRGGGVWQLAVRCGFGVRSVFESVRMGRKAAEARGATARKHRVS